MGFEVITSEKFVEIGAPKVAERIRNKVGDNPVYVSVDIDVLDPAFAPGILLFVLDIIKSHHPYRHWNSRGWWSSNS